MSRQDYLLDESKSICTKPYQEPNNSEISYQSSNKELYFLLPTGPHEIQNKAFLSSIASTACLYTDDFYVRNNENDSRNCVIILGFIQVENFS